MSLSNAASTLVRYIGLGHLVRARRGVAALEFAFTAPLFALLMLATADITFFVRMRLRLDTTARTVGQVVTQYNQLHASDFAAIWQAAQLTAGTVSVSGTFGATIVSGITSSNGKPLISWQQMTGGPGFGSQFGGIGATPTLPGNYVPPSGITVIVVELYTTATPWVFAASVMGGSGTTIVSATTLTQPRIASLASIMPESHS